MIEFLHIPKTAGTSILKAMQGTCEAHKMMCDLQGEAYFSCVRNPYDRACSIYWFMLGRWKHMKKMQPFDMSAEPASLLYFWQTINKRKHPAAQWLSCSQIEYTKDGQTTISPRIKHLLRFETLAEDWPAFAAEYGFNELPHVNKSERPGTWQEEMTPELIDIINEQFAEDFEQLGYERLG